MLPTAGSLRRAVRSWVAARPHQPSGRARLQLELLEDRCLPAAPLVQTGGVVVSSANLVRLYNLDGALGDALGGPTLAAHGGTLGAGRYAFAANQGLQLNGGLLNTANYSIELVMQYSAMNPQWKKIIDFAQLTSDNGLYARNNTLALFPGAAGGGSIAANTDFHVVLARNGTTGATRLYLNGVLQQTYTGSVSNGAVSATNTLIFFEDDNTTGRREAQAGSVDYIAIYDGPLSDADVTTLAQARNAPGGSTVMVDEGQSAAMNGVFHTAAAGNVTVSASIGTISQSTGAHGTWSWSLATDDGPAQSQAVTITATGADGASSTTSFALMVNNLPPSATLSNNGPVSEGSTATVTFANQADPSSADAATFHYAYDFDNDGVFDLGDGTYDGSSDGVSATVPAEYLTEGPGTLVVRGRILDKDGASFDVTTTITIDNAPPTITSVSSDATAAHTGQPGTEVVVQVAFNDPGVADVHHALIDWGDGAQTELDENDAGMDQIANTLTAGHSYAAGGVYTITVTVFDDDGASDVRTTTAIVAGATVRDGVLYVIGTSGADRVTINRQGNGQIKVHADFLPRGNHVKFTTAGITRIVAALNDGNDALTIAGNITLPALIRGGGGDDHLNAGGGGTVLLGEAGNDRLQGGSGRDMLIGGLGQDRLVGGACDDVLTGGGTSIDDDDDALAAALRAWNAAASLAARTAAINALMAMLDDGVMDRITGSAGHDLILRGKGDRLGQG